MQDASPDRLAVSVADEVADDLEAMALIEQMMAEAETEAAPQHALQEAAPQGAATGLTA